MDGPGGSADAKGGRRPPSPSDNNRGIAPAVLPNRAGRTRCCGARRCPGSTVARCAGLSSRFHPVLRKRSRTAARPPSELAAAACIGHLGERCVGSVGRVAWTVATARWRSPPVRGATHPSDHHQRMSKRPVKNLSTALRDCSDDDGIYCLRTAERMRRRHFWSAPFSDRLAWRVGFRRFSTHGWPPRRSPGPSGLVGRGATVFAGCRSHRDVVNPGLPAGRGRPEPGAGRCVNGFVGRRRTKGR